MKTKEAQETHLLALYNSALQQLVKNNKARAKTNLLEITNSSLFQQGRGVYRSRRQFVTMCYKSWRVLHGWKWLSESFFEASQIDRTDATWPFGKAGQLLQREGGGAAALLGHVPDSRNINPCLSCSKPTTTCPTILLSHTCKSAWLPGSSRMGSVIIVGALSSWIRSLPSSPGHSSSPLHRQCGMGWIAMCSLEIIGDHGDCRIERYLW